MTPTLIEAARQVIGRTAAAWGLSLPTRSTPHA